MIGSFITLASLDPTTRAKEFLIAMEDYRRSREHLIEDRLRSKLPAGDTVLQEATSYFLSCRGKLYRPLLTLLACEVVGGRYPDAIEAACAVELVHSSSLILDDLPCMDDSDTRRGQASLHKQYGEAVAILAAIYFLNMAYETALKTGEHSNRALSILTQCIGGKNGMIEGQIMDITRGYSQAAVRDSKTGSLIIAAIQLGTCIGRATATDELALLAYAERLGTAFQLRDDVMDGMASHAGQREATAVAYRAADDICQAFDASAAALALAGMAIYAVERNS